MTAALGKDLILDQRDGRNKKAADFFGQNKEIFIRGSAYITLLHLKVALQIHDFITLFKITHALYGTHLPS